MIGYLPDALTAAVTTRKQVMRWNIEGKVLRVDLNPGVIDNNLNFALPMDGSTGRWTLAKLRGPGGVRAAASGFDRRALRTCERGRGSQPELALSYAIETRSNAS